MGPSETAPCLIVGAGPTGLALAAQLKWLGVPFRIVDRSVDRADESRALVVQARTLEILDALGLAETFVARGRTGTRLTIHLGGGRIARVNIREGGAEDTRYPFILFISQAETERILVEHLSSLGVAIERQVELARFQAGDQFVDCVLRHSDGREEQVRAAYLVGCDGAHSLVRREMGFPFEGGSYPQDFVLGDVEVDGPLETDAINPFVGGGGVAVFFPLGTPRTWRVIGMPAGDRHSRGNGSNSDEPPIGPLTLAELQRVVAGPSEGSVTVRDPGWLSRFRLHHRQAARYRSGRVFVAGDAAHIHSPVGGQGMNTGIQDAWNLGWKLALTMRGTAADGLLDTYQAERWRIGRLLLRYTDRAFSLAVRLMSAGRGASWVRRSVVPRLLPLLFGASSVRSALFDFISQLRIRYRRSPLSTEAPPLLGRGPRAGDRLPDARVSLDGHPIPLQRAVIGPHLSLLLCGDPRSRNDAALASLLERHPGLVEVHHLVRQPFPAVLVDEGRALALLGVDDLAQILVRPDGYIAFRCGGSDLDALTRFLAAWFPEGRGI